MKGTKVSKEIKISMESKYNVISAVWAILGVLFWISALGMFIMRDNMPQIPRADIAYIGFLLCFMGYVNAPVILTLMCLMAISIFIYFIFSLYYNQRM